MGNWCEHMRAGLDGLMYIGSVTNLVHVNYCPICGAKRPEEPKSLEWKLANYDYSMTDETSCALAKIAKEHFFDNKKEGLAEHLSSQPGSYRELAQRAIEYLSGGR